VECYTVRKRKWRRVRELRKFREEEGWWLLLLP
jgi:hypothetical protein